MGGLKIYNEDKLEYLLDGYLKNNTILYNSKTVPFYLDVSDAVGDALLFKIDKNKLENKEISEIYIHSYTLSVGVDKLYLNEQSVEEGLYRFKIFAAGRNYYSELFCVKSETITNIDKLKSSNLKFYDKDYFEFSLTGYNFNNSIVNYDKDLSFYIKFENITSYSCELFKIDKEKLNNKIISEFKIKDITLLQNNDKLYYLGATNETGIYRYKLTINGNIYYSEMFKICQESCGTWIFNDDQCFKFNDNLFFDFN